MRFTNLQAALLAIKIWEMDSIVSGVHGKGGLPVLIERKTRFHLIAKLRRIGQLEVVRVLRALLRSGQRKKALSLTTDNGCEFLDSKRIEILFSKINTLLKVYHTHAYAVREKGSVENAHRHVRRWHPTRNRLQPGLILCHPNPSNLHQLHPPSNPERSLRP